MKSIVFGARGMVGSHIVRELDAGVPPWCVSRHQVQGWIQADLARPDTLELPKADVVFCATNARVFAQSLPAILRSQPRRVVVITWTSVFSKINSNDDEERQSILELIDAEKQIQLACEPCGVEWTILRPTLIYDEGRDRNVTQIARLVRRLRFMPLYGKGQGLRQPVHAQDLGRGAVAAAKSEAAANRAYCVAGLENADLPRDGRPHLRCYRNAPALDFASAYIVEGCLFAGESAIPGRYIGDGRAHGNGLGL